VDQANQNTVPQIGMGLVIFHSLVPTLTWTWAKIVGYT